MRNAIPQQRPQLTQQQQLNESIMRTRTLMQQFQRMNNPEAAIMSLLQSNPQLQAIIPAIRGGNGLENIAKQMAQINGLDINQIITNLSNNQ